MQNVKGDAAMYDIPDGAMSKREKRGKKWHRCMERVMGDTPEHLFSPFKFSEKMTEPVIRQGGSLNVPCAFVE
jgi:hypothetical protein